MKAGALKLLDILKGPKQYIVPIYQRTYSWHTSQCTVLFNDILKISKNESSSGHFIGSLVYFQDGIYTQSDVPKLLLIDGQQRLTTVSLLIFALAEFIEEHAIDIDTNPTKLKNYYLINPEEEQDLHYKLLLTRKDKTTLTNLIKGIPQEENHSKRIIQNYTHLKSKINQDNVNHIYDGLLRLIVVDVALEKGVDSPQLIFESLNSTGLDLSQSDLIRNYVLMGQEVQLQNELYEHYWFPMEQNFGEKYAGEFDSFMRSYLAVKSGSVPKINEVYNQFKKYVQGENSPSSITEVVKDIHKFSEYYVRLVLHKEPDNELRNAFKQISKLKVDVSYPFLLPVYHDYVSNIITKDEFLHTLALVENYVFRRAICNIPTNSLNKTFANLYKSIRRDQYLRSIQAAFQLMDNYKRFPQDAEFQRELISRDVYRLRNRIYLLNKLENYNRKEIVFIEEYTIEHVLPQNPDLSNEWKTMLGEEWKSIQDTYLHTLGNLTLTGYNSELSDRSFMQKKTMEGGFNDSPIRLNKYLKEADIWNEEHIRARAKKLAKQALEIWKAPGLSEEQLEPFIPTKKEKERYKIDDYEHLNGHILDLYEALKTRVVNIDPSVKKEYRKLYIAFKATTNFVDVVPQKSKLRLSLNMLFSEVIDSKGLCRNVTDVGRWGNGDVEVGLSSMDQLDDVMDLIQQAFDMQMGE